MLICFTTNESRKNMKVKKKTVRRFNFGWNLTSKSSITPFAFAESFHFKSDRNHDLSLLFFFLLETIGAADASLIEKSSSRPYNLSRGISTTKTDVKINYDTTLLQRERVFYLSSAKGNFLVLNLLVQICHRTVGMKFLCESGMLIAFGHVKLGWNRHFTKFFFLSRNCRFWVFIARWKGKTTKQVFYYHKTHNSPAGTSRGTWITVLKDPPCLS